MKTTLTLLAAITLASCASTKPPSVSGDDRTPVNNAAATRLLTVMAEPVPDEVIQEPDRIFTRQLDPSTFIKMGKDGTVSRIIHVPFLFAGTTFRPTGEQRYRIRRLTTIASRVEVRGRTDGVGTVDSNRLIAMRRGMAAKRYLIELGVPADKVSVSYVANGDHVGDEGSREGRAKNRRVELEFHISPGA